jgi:uncharacterized protein
VKLNVNDIEDVGKVLVYSEPTDTLNALLLHGNVCDFEFQKPAEVRLGYRRSGDEIFFHGRVTGQAIGHCARCLEAYAFDIASNFSFVLVPKSPLGAAEIELNEEDLDLSFYEGEEIDVSPLVLEQIVLALPTRPLCTENCQGLCPQCGINRNNETCECVVDQGDPRLAVLRNLKLKH